MSRLLVVEDEQHLAEGLRFNLEAEGHQVEVAGSAEAGLERLRESRFDLVLLDVMLPGMDGFEAVSRMRERGQLAPVLMLTARGRSEDVLRGLEAGADDYLPKPFELSILMARVNGLLRRAQWARGPAEALEWAGGKIDLENLTLEREGVSIALTVMEANLLKYLLEREGRTVPRKELLESVWGVREDTDTRAVDNFIVRLRKYLEEEPARPRYLLTVRGVGYKFVARP